MLTFTNGLRIASNNSTYLSFEDPPTAVDGDGPHQGPYRSWEAPTATSARSGTSRMAVDGPTPRRWVMASWRSQHPNYPPHRINGSPRYLASESSYLRLVYSGE